MMRIDRAMGFAPVTRPLTRPVAATLIGPSRPTLAQAAAVVESPEAQEIKQYVNEATQQLEGIDQNYSNLIVALGTEGAAQARKEAKAAVEKYQAEYNQIVGVGR